MKRPVKKAVGGAAASPADLGVSSGLRAPKPMPTNQYVPGTAERSGGLTSEYVDAMQKREDAAYQARMVADAKAKKAAAPSRPITAPTPTKESQTYTPTSKVQNVENFINRKYSSATPNLDKSARSGSNESTRAAAGKDPASGPNTAPTKSTFDRNQAYRDFNSVARTFIGQGVPQKAVVQAQGELRKLQLDNKSTPAQHQAAIQGIIARMKGLIPKKAKGGIIKKAKGGMAYAKGGEMMKPVKRAQGGAGKVRKGMMTPEGKIIDAMNKIRGK